MKSLKITLSTLMILFCITLWSQVAINLDESNPDPSAMLDVKSTTSGVLTPRMSAAERDLISSPAIGLLVYVTDDDTFYYNSTSGWVAISTPSIGWMLTGNSGTSPSTNFIGTTDNNPLVFRVNNQHAGEINPINNNSFFGGHAGNNSTGHSNVAIGTRALYYNTVNSNQVAIGDSALFNNGLGALPFEALYNTALGSKALYSNTTGSANIAGGYWALYANTTVSYNICT